LPISSRQIDESISIADYFFPPNRGVDHIPRGRMSESYSTWQLLAGILHRATDRQKSKNVASRRPEGSLQFGSRFEHNGIGIYGSPPTSIALAPY
jgi:hypothetical protein